jgi:hypothetical protein
MRQQKITTVMLGGERSRAPEAKAITRNKTLLFLPRPHNGFGCSGWREVTFTKSDFKIIVRFARSQRNG